MNKRIVIVAHKFLTQPDDDLILYLNSKNYENIIHIRHSFSDAPDRYSWYTWYKKGKIFREYKTIDYKFLPEILIYLKEGYFTIKWILDSRLTYDVFIGMDGLCVLWGIMLRGIKKVNKTVYWAIDFVPKNRFKGKWKNLIYHFVNTQGYKKADEMWDLSPRMQEAREKFLGIPPNVYKKQKIVPYGTWLGRIKKYSYEECDKNTVVFMGHLLEKQGAQWVIQSMPLILKKNPDFRFKIIGTGQYKQRLEELAKRVKVLDYCYFMGKIEDHKVLENEIARSVVAVAPYIKELDTWTYYADPGKVKTYLACGVPVLLTDLPWNAHDIEKNKCGFIIDGEKDLIGKIIELMEEKKNKVYRKNAIKYARQYDYEQLFDKLGI